MEKIYKIETDVLLHMPDDDFLVLLKVCYLEAIMREKVYAKLPEKLKHYFSLVEGDKHV